MGGCLYYICTTKCFPCPHESRSWSSPHNADSGAVQTEQTIYTPGQSSINQSAIIHSFIIHSTTSPLHPVSIVPFSTPKKAKAFNKKDFFLPFSAFCTAFLIFHPVSKNRLSFVEIDSLDKRSSIGSFLPSLPSFL